MARTNYQRGADRERRILNSFKDKGWIALRSAGSNSPIDVVCIDVKRNQIKLIQSKMRNHGKDRLCEPERKRLEEEGEEFNGLFSVEFEVWD